MSTWPSPNGTATVPPLWTSTPVWTQAIPITIILNRGRVRKPSTLRNTTALDGQKLGIQTLPPVTGLTLAVRLLETETPLVVAVLVWPKEVNSLLLVPVTVHPSLLQNKDWSGPLLTLLPDRTPTMSAWSQIRGGQTVTTTPTAWLLNSRTV